MPKTIVLFSNHQSPSQIRGILNASDFKFLDINARNCAEEIKKTKPQQIFLDNTCPKKTKKVLNNLPAEFKTTIVYVGGAQRGGAVIEGAEHFASWIELSKFTS